jgi:hypothetical protein
MENGYTENFVDFRDRERVLLVEILNAWNNNGLPLNFWDDGVKPAFNANSGYVFLVNSEYQTAMMNGDKLELWHSLPYSGQEGFIDDLLEIDPETLNSEDVEYLQQYAEKVNHD